MTHTAGRATLHLFLPISVMSSMPQEKGTFPLEPDKPIERELAGDQAHSYQLILVANQYLHLIVDQRGIDVVVSLFGPDNQKLAEVDSPNGTQGPEPVVLVVETSGNYRLEIRSLDKNAPAGKYEVKINELRLATAQDKERIAGRRAFAEAEQLSAQDTSEGYRKALEKYDEAIMHFRAAADRNNEATALNNKGLAYMLSGEYKQALDYFAQARSIFLAIKDREGEAMTLGNFGFVYDELGEKQKALDDYNQALKIFRDLGDRQREAFMLINLGSLYFSLGDSSQPQELYTRALSLCQSLKNRDCEATALGGIGRVYYTVGDKKRAIDNYNQMLSIYRDMDFPRGQSTALFHLAVAYSDLGEKQKALDYYTQVLALSRTAGFKDAEVATLNKLGVLYSDLGEKQKAIEHYNQALSLSRLMNSRSDEADALYNIARYESERGDLESARVRIEAALSIIESLRANVVGEELRSSYFASVQGLYGFYVDLLMRLHKQQPSKGYDAAALQGSERARARSLVELLTEARANINQGVDPSLLDRERTLQQQLNAKAARQTRLSNMTPSDDQAATLAKEIEALETEIKTLTNEYRQVRAQIRVKSPRYAALTQPQPASLGEIQQMLDPNTMLLEYALGEERSYLWVVTRASLKSYELPKRAEIEGAARRLYDLINIRGQAPQNNDAEYREWRVRVARANADYPQAAAQLSRMLLGQVADDLGGKRLVIVSEGVLQYLPFAALPEPAEKGAGNSQPLIARHEVVTLPSASTLVALRREGHERRPYAKSVIVFADPVFDADDARVAEALRSGQSRPSDSAGRRQTPTAVGKRDVVTGVKAALRSAENVGLTNRGRLRRLLWSRGEAEAIVASAPAGDAIGVLGFDASRQRVLTEDLSQYRIVHFATHGLLNSRHPELSGVVLSLVDRQGSEQDGFLRLHEIFNLKLPVDMVVLSACQTGLGREIRGEGLVGLTRGFMYAGTPRVVASLWSVDDAATAELMRIFYRKMLRDEQPPAAALRAAQNELRQQEGRGSPFYWAGFVLQGEWQNITK